MTSLKEHTGRPEIDPWLRGWVQDDLPQTAVIWRTYLPVRAHVRATPKEIEAFFEAAPPHASETLETETYRVVDWLTARAQKVLATAPRGMLSTEPEDGESASGGLPLWRDDVAAIALTLAGDFSAMWRLDELVLHDDADAKKHKDALEGRLKRATLIVDARMGGLQDGLLSDREDNVPRTVDDGTAWMPGPADHTGELPPATAPIVKFRVRTAEAEEHPVADQKWRERLRFATELSEEGEPSRWLVVEKWGHDATTEDDRSAGRPQLLDEHQSWTEDRARDLARRLCLPEAYVDMLGIAGRLHDEGKQAPRWQRAFNAKRDGVYAKTRGPLNSALLDGYRHEFGSLPFAAKDARFSMLPADLQDLALHLIAAHHGFARPVISTNGCEDAPPSALEERAREVALRFVRLQKRWGPWGLAWWEALLRAADQQASRENDAKDSTVVKESD
jgi:CRISPR-associated endonuclease/helicase Cas3